VSADLYAVGTAIAAKFEAVTAPASTMGGTAIKAATVGVQSVTSTPYVVVELPEGQVETALAIAPRRSSHDYNVYFLFTKASGDVPRDTAVMLKWLGPLLTAVDAGNRLGLGSASGYSVLKSGITNYEPGQYEVGGQPYHSWHFTVTVNVEEYNSVTQ
jgi:hypothetical protein